MRKRTHPLLWPILGIVAATAASVALFAILASEIVEGELAAADGVGRQWAHSARTPFADSFFGAATHLGGAIALAIICLGAAALLRRRYDGRLLVPILLSPLLASLTAQLLKGFFSRARPLHPLLAARGFSFPSGHTMTATAVAFTLAYIFVREKLIARIHVIWAVFFVLLVGASRVYLGVHWASDVFGGWVAGTAIAASCCLLYERATASSGSGARGVS